MPQATTSASQFGVRRLVSGVDVQKFIILMAAIIFAAAGLLIGMSYKQLFPASDRNPPTATAEPPQTTAPEETTVTQEASTAQPQTGEVPTKNFQPVTSLKDDSQENQDKSSPPPVSVMEELIETQFQEIESLKKEVTALQQENQAKNQKLQDLERRAEENEKENKAKGYLPKSVAFLGDDLFSPGQVTLSARGMELIRQLAGKVKSKNKYRLVVCGHTDNTNLGRAKTKLYKDNLGLSVARALEAARGLISAGVPPEMIGVCGYGDSRPTAPNNNAANMAKNRRVVVSFLPLESD